MSYILKNNTPFISIKLTEKGREQLSLGKLSFNYWAIGDSEINYNREEIVENNLLDPVLSGSTTILKPVDKQPNIQSYISSSTSTNNPFQVISDDNLNVIKATVNNEATERGFFDVNGNNISDLLVDNHLFSNTLLTGTNILSFALPLASIGDLIILKIGNSVNSYVSTLINNDPTPVLVYKIIDINGSDITLDRNLPNVSADGGNSVLLVYKSGENLSDYGYGSNSLYWDSGTLSFNSNININCSDVPIWNLNNVWCENILGITGLTTTNLYEDYTKFGSFSYLGNKYPFFDVSCVTNETTTTSNICNQNGVSELDSVNKSISIIHYSNNSISNVYGEFIYNNDADDKNLEITIPNIMYHRRYGVTGSGDTYGMTFIASGDTTTVNGLESISLYEKPDLLPSGVTSNVIGKMYPQLKVVVIMDDEITAALSYKSNRNWTLPELSASLENVTSGDGVLNVGETMYLTYVFENGSFGLKNSLPCQKYIKITNNTSASKNISFKLNDVDLLSYMRKKEDGGYDGLGFYAKNFKLLYQKVTSINDRPESGSWKVSDFTSTQITGNVGETINPVSLENQNYLTNGFILTKTIYDSGLQYSIIDSLNLPLNTDYTALQFGDERVFFGNLNTYIGATIYKSIFDIKINGSDFNYTTNPTKTQYIDTDIKISEVGIYDSDKNLVCIGKLSTPISIVNDDTIMLELSMDF